MAGKRQLFVLRHAKSSWDDASLADFDRPLAPRGEKTAPLMGAEIAKRGWLPEFALVSASLRTRETWRLATASWPQPLPAVAYPQELYEASAAEILAEVQAVPHSVGTLLVLGHNPGLETFIRMLAGPDSAETALRLVREKFPTGALARLELTGGWDSLGPGSATLTHMLRPKDVG